MWIHGSLRMQEWRDKSEIHIYQRIQLSNNKFINGILGVRLTWLDCKAVAPSVNHTMRRWVFRPKLHISGLKIHRGKTQMKIKRKFKWTFSYFWCGLRRDFSYKMVLRGIQRCFLRGAQNVLFWHQDSEDFSGILYSMVKKVTFLKGNLLGINVLQTFYKFCHWR